MCLGGGGGCQLCTTTYRVCFDCFRERIAQITSLSARVPVISFNDSDSDTEQPAVSKGQRSKQQGIKTADVQQKLNENGWVFFWRLKLWCMQLPPNCVYRILTWHRSYVYVVWLVCCGLSSWWVSTEKWVTGSLVSIGSLQVVTHLHLVNPITHLGLSLLNVVAVSPIYTCVYLFFVSYRSCTLLAMNF